MRTNIRLLFLGVTLLAGTLLGSCQKDPLTPDPGKGGAIKQGLNLSINTLGSGGDAAAPGSKAGANGANGANGNAPGSKAVVTDPTTLAGTEAERTVKTLDLFLFDSDGGDMVSHLRLSENGGTIGGVSSTFPATSSAAWANIPSATLNAFINSGGFGTRTLAVVANWDETTMGSVLKDRLATEGSSLVALEQMVIEAPFTMATEAQTLPYKAPGLLMFGKSNPQTYNTSATIPSFQVDLTRMAARLDLKLSVSAAMAAAAEVAEVRVMQAANRGYLGAPTSAAGESTMPEYTVQNKSVDGLFANSTINTTAESFSKTIYLPENNLRAGSYTRTNATCVLVNIPLGGTPNWYRFWVNESDDRTVGNNYHVGRNTLYQIAAVISTKGGATPDDAVETQDAHFGDVFYTLSYDVQPGMSGAPTLQRYRLGETITVPNVEDMGAAGRDRYPVVLNTKADETGTVYYPGDTFTITGNTTLYARLRPTAPRITLAPDGTLAITYDARDAGLYFKFGSVVGIYSGHHANQILPGNNSDTYDAGDVAFNPTGSTFVGWDEIPLATELADVDYSYHTHARVMAGKGDPCRLVGLTQADIQAGTFDNGTWRLPTQADNVAFQDGALDNSPYTEHWWNLAGGINPSPWGVVGGEFGRRNRGRYDNFLPASGTRDDGDGKVVHIGFRGIYSSNKNKLDGYVEAFGFEPAIVWARGGFGPQSGKSIRCVRQGVPRITIGTGSDGNPMLTLTDDPIDGGLLFEYGSTVGIYSAGGQRNMNNSTGWAPFIVDNWSPDDVAFDPRNDANRTPINTIQDVTYEATALIADRDFHHQPGKVNAEGRGDACRLVGLTQTDVRNGNIDNGIWRLPTHAEVTAMFPSAEVNSTHPGTTIPGYKMTGTAPNYYGWLPRSLYRRYGHPLYGEGAVWEHLVNHAHWSQSSDLYIGGTNIGLGGVGDEARHLAGIRFCVRQ